MSVELQNDCEELTHSVGAVKADILKLEQEVLASKIQDVTDIVGNLTAASVYLDLVWARLRIMGQEAA